MHESTENECVAPVDKVGWKRIDATLRIDREAFKTLL